MSETVLRKGATMKGSTIGLISLLVLLASQALPADPIRLGFLFTMSGRSAAHGVIAKQGADTALAEANASGGIMGREVVGLFEDEGKPDTSVKVVEKLVNQDKVDAIIGVVSSAVASKVAAAAKDLHVPLIVTTAHANEVTGQQCKPVHFSRYMER
jgi:branched-chain amino acid transport system substrate-binding protein